MFTDGSCQVEASRRFMNCTRRTMTTDYLSDRANPIRTSGTWLQLLIPRTVAFPALWMCSRICWLRRHQTGVAPKPSLPCMRELGSTSGKCSALVVRRIAIGHFRLGSGQWKVSVVLMRRPASQWVSHTRHRLVPGPYETPFIYLQTRFSFSLVLIRFVRLIR